MPALSNLRPATVAFVVAGLLMVIFGSLLGYFRRDLREQIHRRIIERDATVLYPMALLQLREAEAETRAASDPGRDPVLAVLRSAGQSGMLGVAVFDANGNALRTVPATMLFADLSPVDYLELTKLKPISRYHEAFALRPVFAASQAGESAPVLEVLIPLHLPGQPGLQGVAQYFIDARPLAGELAAIDRQINLQMLATLAIGFVSVLVVVVGGAWGLSRAQRIIAERNERLIRANYELTLAAKASVLGQITSHLVHGLQGQVAGLRAVLAAHPAAEGGDDWQAAAGYTDRLQSMIHETVALLGERSAETSYELSGHDLASILRERHRAAALARGVPLTVSGGFGESLDSPRGSLLCLVTGNLIENAILASPAGQPVEVRLELAADRIELTVSDHGTGIPAAVLSRLFEPGVSSRTGGSGLGLAISRLLARHIGADLRLVRTGPAGTAFAVSLGRVGDGVGTR